MSKTNDMGGPAFPHPDRIGGVTVWDYYAAAALAGISSDSEVTGSHARWAAETADDMLDERAKRLVPPPNPKPTPIHRPGAKKATPSAPR